MCSPERKRERGTERERERENKRVRWNAVATVGMRKSNAVCCLVEEQIIGITAIMELGQVLA